MSTTSFTLINPTGWRIKQSHMCSPPESIWVGNIAELRKWVQDFADTKHVRVDRPAIGQVHFRYELDEQGDQATVVHAYFDGTNGKRRRFMRLERIMDDITPEEIARRAAKHAFGENAQGVLDRG